MSFAVGGWNFSVWSLTDESSESGASNTPLIKSGLGKTRYSAGQWSETRPSCFYLGTDCGTIEIWDILERTNEPALVQSVSSMTITNIQLKVINPKQHLLAISDAQGTVHILQVPYILRAPSQANEIQHVEAYFNREVERINYFDDKLQVREGNKGGEGSGDGADDKIGEDEQNEIDTKFYEQFTKFQGGVRSQLGLEVPT